MTTTTITKATRKASRKQTGTKGHPAAKNARKGQRDGKIATPKADTSYKGAPIAATKVYRRKMVEFKNCDAEAWMIVNDVTGTVTHANTYNGILKASYNPDHYTYPINEKVIGKKLDNMIEVESPADYPTWIVLAIAKKSRKPNK